MSSYRNIALKIPDRVRSERLLIDADPIYNARPHASNKDMQLLFAIWSDFIEKKSSDDMYCPICLRNILQNFREIKDELINIEKDYQLLKAIIL